MSPYVLALGVAALTASGCVWYLPALADLRAGDDRPVSLRTAAAGCLTGWATLAALALPLLADAAWWVPCAVAAVGAVATATLRVRARVHRKREAAEQEELRRWAAV
ncbi:putative Syd protein [Streptomyces sp. NBRC 110611]|uniref:hypothetical protein n=1 Tax=Streptomyces sp. NBRC 110611 TaxID=1621259 RepID=UPI000829F5F3|nr:hypothetical protein [Streptomyces sp. NBRC 110611]GAU67272.1 putative Syd protein [Streptomyces sp. NBRC 110611]